MRERLLDLMDRNGLGAVVLRRPEDFACGRRGRPARCASWWAMSPGLTPWSSK